MLPDHKPALWITQFEADRLAFEVALKREFPDVRFVLRHRFLPGEEPHITFVDSLCDERAPKFGAEAWFGLEPGWQPLWGPLVEGSTSVECLNRPRFWIGFSWICPVWRDTTWLPLAGEPDLEGEVPVEATRDSYLYSSWVGDDRECANFVRRIFRLAKKGATNKLFGVDLDTGLPRFPPSKGGIWWAAPHVIEWLRGAPNRFMEGNMRLAEEYETYRWPLPTRETALQVRQRIVR